MAQSFSHQSIDNARSNFLLSLRENARLFSIAGPELGKEENCAQK